MPTISTLEPTFEHALIEEECRRLWDESGIHRFQPEGEGEIFSVDTPPPYVSAAHLHVGHAMSYAQAEFIVRYQRMRGRRIFYPMGFDDNGLPTERYVEKILGIDKRRTTRAHFRALCLQETRAGARGYEALWRGLGLSVDWSLSYSTIDDHCRATSQRAFLALYKQGRIYRSAEPVLWDPALETALAQADVEVAERRGTLHDIAFAAEESGEDLTISTTRPELLPACVALYRNPADPRYAHLAGKRARVPLAGRTVPILADADVLADYGTGLMMVCTFGDAEDAARWRRDGLETRIILGPDGRMTEAAGAYAGLPVTNARPRILADLQAGGFLRGSRPTQQRVAIAERSEAAVEFQLIPQWFLRILDLREPLLARAAQLDWRPAWMRVRLEDWINGLKYDWNLSRQRFYGVPFPLWRCAGCGEVVLAREEDLPVDPLEAAPPLAACPACGGALEGEPDVMDTWATSSLTPFINANAAGTPGRAGCPLPMSARVQAFEIIRTWLFYSLVQGHLHADALPWEAAMISGWGLNEQGKKISKRDLEKYTGEDGYNRYDPAAVIARYGADALRHWAAGSRLGHDSRYNEKDVRAGRKLAVKLWNAARFASLELQGFDPAAPRAPAAARPPEDGWLLARLAEAAAAVTAGFERYDYAAGLEALDRFFWSEFCDDWLETAKDRLARPERYPEGSRAAAQATLWEALRALLGLYAPFVPFVSEAAYQRLYQPFEGAVSLHITAWPAPEAPAADSRVELARAILHASRALRTARRIPQGRGLRRLVLDLAGASAEEKAAVSALEATIRAATRAARIEEGAAEAEVPGAGLRIDFEEEEAPE